MSFHRCMTLANPNGGTMAATSSRYRKRISRQQLRRSCQLVAPGEKMLDVVEQAFPQQGYQKLPVQPGTATVLPLLGPITQPEDRFEPLEAQFDLPAATIPGQNSRPVQRLRRHLGPDEEVTRQEQNRPRHLLLLLGRPLPQRPPLQSGRPAVSFDRHQSSWVVPQAVADDGRPLLDLSHLRRTQSRGPAGTVLSRGRTAARIYG